MPPHPPRPPSEAAPPLPDDPTLDTVAAAAVELARFAGSQIVDTLQHEIVVEYKDEPRDGEAPSNPVSEVDHAVERLVRERLAERFPDHVVVGEEVEEHPDPTSEWAWAIDPVDGTTNFVNGFPLFSASFGVLHHGRPVASAIRCSTGHTLEAGVYHSRLGGELRFEERPVPPGRPSRGVARRLSAVPGGMRSPSRSWDTRTTGSAAIECAFVAAGIFASAIFWRPSIWDVAAGVGLVQAGSGEVLTRRNGVWVPFEQFAAPASLPARSRKTSTGDTPAEEREPSLRDWHEPLLMGAADALAELQDSLRPPGRWQRSRRWLGQRVAGR